MVLLPCENDEEGVLILMVESDKESDTESYLPVEDDNLLAVIFEMFKEITLSEVDKIYKLLKSTEISKIDNQSKKFNRKFVVVPVYMAKGLEFDSVIIYTDRENKFTSLEKYLYYFPYFYRRYKFFYYVYNMFQICVLHDKYLKQMLL